MEEKKKKEEEIYLIVPEKIEPKTEDAPEEFKESIKIITEPQKEQTNGEY